MMSLCLSVLLSALDLTIVTTAVPAIVGTFRSFAGYTWVGSAYLGLCGYYSGVGVWGRDLGPKTHNVDRRCDLRGGGSPLSPRPHMDALLVGRVIKGLGASGMKTMVNVVASDMFSLRDRGDVSRDHFACLGGGEHRQSGLGRRVCDEAEL
ncbi:hypothetical protein BBP40_002660 [Aspergillus hancockii]|nr:hypothetical protein BBP40_002660 [Aspergillus hancockii]